MGKPIIERVYFGVKCKRKFNGFTFPLPFIRTYDSEYIQKYSPEGVKSCRLFIEGLLEPLQKDFSKLIKQSIFFYLFNKPCEKTDTCRTYFCIINGEDATMFNIVPTYEKTKGMDNRGRLVMKNLKETYSNILEFYLAINSFEKALVQHHPSLDEDE
jgi:hypothetical protein